MICFTLIIFLNLHLFIQNKLIKMIYNIIILIGANVLIPLIPFPPQIFVLYNVYDYQTQQVSVFEVLNMSRLYTQQQFKKSFRESMKKLHPDRGGTQQQFDRVKNIKKIMESQNNYYDLLNVTHIDLAYNQPMKQIVQMKQTVYYFETGIFYFIALLYILAFTIDDELRSSRKVLLPLTIIFAYYEYHIHTNPGQTTVIDYLLTDRMPLFTQKDFLKRIYCILIAIIRVYYLRSITQQRILFKKLENLSTLKSKNQQGESKKAIPQEQIKNKNEDLLKILSGIYHIYLKKVQKQKKDSQSWTTKIRNWVSKGFSLAIFGLMLWGILSPGDNGQQNEMQM